MDDRAEARTQEPNSIDRRNWLGASQNRQSEEKRAPDDEDEGTATNHCQSQRSGTQKQRKQ